MWGMDEGESIYSPAQDKQIYPDQFSIGLPKINYCSIVPLFLSFFLPLPPTHHVWRRNDPFSCQPVQPKSPYPFAKSILNRHGLWSINNWFVLLPLPPPPEENITEQKHRTATSHVEPKQVEPVVVVLVSETQTAAQMCVFFFHCVFFSGSFSFSAVVVSYAWLGAREESQTDRRGFCGETDEETAEGETTRRVSVVYSFTNNSQIEKNGQPQRAKD